MRASGVRSIAVSLLSPTAHVVRSRAVLPSYAEGGGHVDGLTQTAESLLGRPLKRVRRLGGEV
jgi:hypothetical protein